MKEIDKIYVAKYYEQLGSKEVALSFQNYYTKEQIEEIVEQMKNTGIYAVYRDLSDEEWIRLENKSDKYIIEKYYKKARYDLAQKLISLFRINFQEVIREFPKYMYSKNIHDRDYFQEANYEGEEWKQIGKLNYLISNYGRIKNKTTKKLKQLKWSKYGMQVILWDHSKSYTITVSRMVAELFIRHLEKNERAKHINGNIRDNYYKNLEIVSM